MHGVVRVVCQLAVLQNSEGDFRSELKQSNLFLFASSDSTESDLEGVIPLDLPILSILFSIVNNAMCQFIPLGVVVHQR